MAATAPNSPRRLGRGHGADPGNAFSAAQTAGTFMRFNVAQMDEGSFAVLRRVL